MTTVLLGHDIDCFVCAGLWLAARPVPAHLPDVQDSVPALQSHVQAKVFKQGPSDGL